MSLANRSSRERVIDNLHRRAKAFGFALQPLEPTPDNAVS
jgi:transposase